ncbi:hypothetical protein Ssi03_72010 [Sphaerisporangium siamense]|uniref:Uncharacterized protein n=1 Tax=Sphaerisporangium siamense TaxID=795645 RepID=A0A7W7DBX0_9ACTN|nr:hypothetical protein [Sphaerisporangium siamense]MBB4703190.1 hypothetical protein [Sphaerisporangium siamense]GII89211.1 hypothetical protein Ssi03_72010 [Sphaerisporangium siamense]
MLRRLIATGILLTVAVLTVTAPASARLRGGDDWDDDWDDDDWDDDWD